MSAPVSEPRGVRVCATGPTGAGMAAPAIPACTEQGASSAVPAQPRAAPGDPDGGDGGGGRLTPRPSLAAAPTVPAPGSAPLTMRELTLVAYLRSQAPRVVPGAEIAREAWGMHSESTQTVDDLVRQHVMGARRRLGPRAYLLRTARGWGFRAASVAPLLMPATVAVYRRGRKCPSRWPVAGVVEEPSCWPLEVDVIVSIGGPSVRQTRRARWDVARWRWQLVADASDEPEACSQRCRCLCHDGGAR